jgi:hypothetical protein
MRGRTLRGMELLGHVHIPSTIMPIETKLEDALTPSVEYLLCYL